MLLKIIWDLWLNSFAPKNIPLQQILSSWGTGIDSSLVSPKSLGSGFKTSNSQKLVPESNRHNAVLDPWRVKRSLFQVAVQWFFGDCFRKPGCLCPEQITILQHFNGAEFYRMDITWLFLISDIAESICEYPYWSPCISKLRPWFSAWRCLPIMSAIATNSQCL